MQWRVRGQTFHAKFVYKRKGIPAFFFKVTLCQKLSSKFVTVPTPPPAALAAKLEAAAVDTVIDDVYFSLE